MFGGGNQPPSPFTFNSNATTPASGGTGFMFGQQLPNQPQPAFTGSGQPATSQPAAGATPAFGGFGPLKLSDLETATTAQAVTAAAPTPGPLKLSDLGTSATKPPELFGAVTATTALTTTPAVAAIAVSMAPATTAVIPGASTTAAPASARSVGPSTLLRNKTVEQIVNDWKTQTMKSEQEFRKLAVEIGKWDVMLWKNGEELTKLTKEVEGAEETQRLIDQNLEYIESEQSQMDEALASYETEIRKIFQSDGPERIRMTPADQEREKAYGLAASLNSQFDDMLRQLSSMVEDINATLHPSDVPNGAANGNSTEGETGTEQSAYTQVVRILNHHLSSLRWLDSQVKQLDKRVNDIERYRSAAENVVARVYSSGSDH